jgi:hypothetical protein
MRRTLVALPLLLATAAAASTPLEDYARRAIQSLPVHHEDRDYVDKAQQLEAIALAVAERSKRPPAGISPRRWMALLFTIGFHESGFAERIERGACKDHECDGGRACGDWQNHANRNNQELWDRCKGDVAVQAEMADQALRSAYWTCARSGVPFPQATLSAYAGQRCGGRWKGLDERVLTFNRLVAK